MTNVLTPSLEELLVREWGLIKTLRDNAIAYQKELLSDIKSALEQHPRYAEAAGGAVIKTLGDGFYVSFEHSPGKYLSYTQVDTRCTSVALELRVFTGFNTTGVTARKVKAEIGDDLLEKQREKFNDTALSMTLLKSIAVQGRSREALIEAVVTEVIEQLPIADELFTIVSKARGL